MATNVSGVSAYQQASSAWSTKGSGRSGQIDTQIEATRVDEKWAKNATGASNTTAAAGATTGTWKPSSASSLIPTNTKYGSTIGDVQLSEKAQAYYDKLKAKYHNADFILVSKDMKSQVQANAASYGNANKQVVLIDEEKIERMATDESYRKKYEGIIAMSQSQLANAKNSLASSGASVKNFGMSVDENGNTSFFATLDKSSDAQTKRAEKKAEAKKQEKKAQAKQAQQERIEHAREEKRAEKKEAAERLEAKRDEKRADRAEGRPKRTDTAKADKADTQEYLEVRSNTIDGLLAKVSDLAYSNSARNVRTSAERNIGQSIDFKG